MTPEQREAELLQLLADGQVHQMPDVYALDDTCSQAEWLQLAQDLKNRQVVDFTRFDGTIRLLANRR